MEGKLEAFPQKAVLLLMVAFVGLEVGRDLGMGDNLFCYILQIFHLAEAAEEEDICLFQIFP